MVAYYTINVLYSVERGSELEYRFLTFHNTIIIASEPLEMGNNAIINLKDPGDLRDATTKKKLWIQKMPF